MTVPKYYYNLNRCISDGKNQFDTTNMPKETYEVNGQTYCGSNDLMDLLNELHEENEQLKYNLSAHMVDLNNCKGKCSALEKENEQLKQTIENICKDYEEAHGMDIRNAEWFTCW